MNHRGNVRAGIAFGGAVMVSLLGCSPAERSFGDGQGGSGQGGSGQGGSGQGGSGQGGSGGSQASGTPGGDCASGQTVPCYEGPAATRGVGACRPGVTVCQENGTFGACDGQVLPAVEDCSTPADDDCNGEREGCTLATEWARGYPAPTNNNFAQGVAAGPMGTVTIVGNYNGALEFGGVAIRSDADDGFVAQLSVTGEFVWARGVSGAGSQRVSAVAVDAMGTVYIAGYFNALLDLGDGTRHVSNGDLDAFVARLGPDGTPQWVLTGGDAGAQRATALTVNRAGEVIVGGQMTGSIGLGGRGVASPGGVAATRAFLFKLTPEGRAVWGTSFGGDTATDVVQLNGLSVDEMGNPVLAGDYQGRILGANGGVTSRGGQDCVIAKADGTRGDPHWVRSFGSEGADVCSGVAVDSRGNVVIAGRFGAVIALDAVTLAPIEPGRTDNLLFARLGPGGQVISAATYGSSLGAFVRTDSRDNVVLGGSYAGTLDFGGGRLSATPSSTRFGILDMYVAKLGVGGQHLASRTIGSENLQALLGLAVDDQDHVLLAGGTVGALDMGTGMIGAPDATSTSPLVARLAP